MSDELLPCPFCGSTGISVDDVCAFFIDPPLYRAVCHDCHAEGPAKEILEDAVEAWNTRKGSSEK